MNRIAIFYPLALLCISFAFAQEKRDILCKLKGAIVVDRDDSSDNEEDSDSHTYEKEVNLYRTVDANGNILHYDIEDGLGVMSAAFKIHPFRIVVTEEAISIRYSTLTIILSPNGETFPLYRKLIPRENYTRHFSVKGTFDEVKNFDTVSVKLEDNRLGGDWVFMALKGKTPRLLFPGTLVNADSISNGSARTIIADLEAERDIRITIELANPTEFDELFKMMTQVWIR